MLEFLHACMRSTYAGEVVWQDDSDANAAAMAATLERAARRVERAAAQKSAPVRPRDLAPPAIARTT